MFEDFFININIMIALIFTYMKIRWSIREETHSAWKSYVIDGLCGGLLGWALMHFSIRVGTETLVDLRFIPILLMFLFIGKVPTFISVIFIACIRFIYGVNISSYSAVIMLISLFIGYIVIEKITPKEDSVIVRGMYMVIYSNVVISVLLYYVVRDFDILIALTPTYWVMGSIAGLSSILLVNYMRTSEYLYRKYENESTIDFLTGLKNVRNFDSIWKYSEELANKKGKPLSLVMLDIDHFKRINDTYGHAAGDFVLMEISRIMEEVVGNKGSVFRKGGEEFAIILPLFRKEQAEEMAETVRSRVERHRFAVDDETKLLVTISCGYVSYPEIVKQTDNMVELADVALYQAKETGRNKVLSL
ncbi:diguanylate cyclase [Marinilactibacillus sp. Marseille-P9653]|uniref:GGDEF domain-containing protein n=1 Tax=Marinilactibacillus sp. Marseille-P9653 TaxID=2866583 RepID=UPI001CE3F6D9|nr:GGDEF domain-containing protein [Marinilactibacillus sp. Marseille-P9653]